MRQVSSQKLVKMVSVALLSAVSVVLFFISFPLPLLPPYLKVDFSDVPALLAALVFSPFVGIVVIFIKNFLYFFVSGATDPVGVVANFIAGTIYIYPVAYMYHRYKKTKNVIAGLVIGTTVMAVVMAILNYIVILPAYAWVLGAADMATPAVKKTTVLAGVLPFNFIKGVIVSILFSLLFVRMKVWIEQKHVQLTVK
ncbi:MAG TPA: ECF transporter S component [Pseudogracilibacillus sp.]|nr:ECF transporter S component [Pseudogracilibacillus sp.]